MNLEKQIVIVVMILGFVVQSGEICLAESNSQLLQQGLYAEEIEGDLEKAMVIYEQIIKDDSAEDTHTAQAMYLLGMCYLKKQNESQARIIFEKLTTRFPEQTAILEKVRPILDDIGDNDPAALMPPETMIYVEVGSPGKQIETILQMLSGTPLANPLAVIGRGGAGQKSPGEIMGALLNPSMMAEFKKIRGMGVGVSGIGNQSPMIAVLYPGKSDALRGIVLAALGVLGKPDEPIEGMQTMLLGENAGVAHDDKVIIMVQNPKPIDQLTWCVKQYLGFSSEPTLLSQNQAFARISRKERKDNALTMWINGAEFFPILTKQFGTIDQVRLIDGIADLESIEEVITYLSIKQTGIVVEANVGFKEGHNCLPYNLIRTPNLSRTGFSTVPSDAVGLVSIALSEPEGNAAQIVHSTVENITGLDVGREIFNNIEQITLFVLPTNRTTSEDMLAKDISPILPCVGLTLTSHDPQKTHQLLNQLLSVADLMAGKAKTKQSSTSIDSTPAKYRIGTVKNKPIYCYMNQKGKTTVLALSPETVNASLSTIKNQQSVLTGGPLQNIISQLPVDTSKLVLINAGGAIKLASDHIHKKYDISANSENYPLNQLFSQLAEACGQTSVLFRTGEKANNFNFHLSLNQLPQLGQIFPLAMQIPRLMQGNLTVFAVEPQPADAAILASDTTLQLRWTAGLKATSHQVYFGTSPDDPALLGEVTNSVYEGLPEMQSDTRYFWRIDEVQPDGTVVTGETWSFTTGKMIGWWKFDEGSGNIAADSSGNSNDGVITGAVWVDGRIDKALEFDGVDDYVDTGDTSDLSSWTVAVWVKSSATPSAAPMSGPVHYGNTFHISWNHPDPLFRGAPSAQVGGRWYAGSFGTLEANTWYHLCASYDGERLKTYTNGAFVADNPSPSGTSDNKESPLVFGRHSTVEQYFGGTIDDIRIYNYALGEAEIEAIYKDAPPPPDATNPDQL